jgi:ribosomal protein S18 acetylase RimI-like enzyme
VWHALTSHNARLAEVAGGARRYPPEVAPFGGVAHLDAGAWSDLARLAEGGGAVLLARADPIDAPEGWTVAREILGHQMLLGSPPAVPAPTSMRTLTTEDVPAMLALAGLARPGPFSVRTVEFGGYLGVEDGGVLVAMAGERLHFDRYCEISAVCTHPDARGHGLAAALTLAVAERIAERGEQPLLHVADDNVPARRLYERLGFETRTQIRFVALRPPAPPA